MVRTGMPVTFVSTPKAIAIGRSCLSSLLVLLSLALMLPVPTAMADAPAGSDYAIQNGWFYTQANGKGGGPGQAGYAVTNDANIPFFTTFHQGGVSKYGYPASPRFTFQGFTDQVMQKAVFQSQGNTVAYLNVMDILHTQGKDGWLQATYQTPPPEDTTPDTGLTFAQVQARHDAFLDSNPALKAAYFAVADPLSLYGLPVTHPTAEFNGQALVVRTQRAVLQLWLVDMPWAKAQTVSVANGGDIFKMSGLAAAVQLAPIANVPPGGVAPAQVQYTPLQIAQGALLVQSDLPTGFVSDPKGVESDAVSVGQTFYLGQLPNAFAVIADNIIVESSNQTAQELVLESVAVILTDTPKNTPGAKVTDRGPVPGLGQVSDIVEIDATNTAGVPFQIFMVNFSEQSYAVAVVVASAHGAITMDQGLQLARIVDSRLPH